MIVEPANFDFQELSQWYERLAPLFNAPGMVLTDIDEAQNRIVLGVINGAAKDVLSSQISRMQPPAGIVAVEVRSPVELVSAMSSASSATLTDLNTHSVVRPVPAAVTIGNRAGGWCTISWNAKYYDYALGHDGVKYLVTASHCSSGIWSNDGDTLGQPDISHAIGKEVADPPPFHNAENSLCPVGADCRYSDALLMKYNKFEADTTHTFTTWKYGYFPSVGNAYPFDILGYRTFTSVDDSQNNVLYVGWSLEKTGDSTGTTTGTVRHTCVGIHVYIGTSYTGRFLPCQFQATNLLNHHGDSGSPIYHVDALGDVNLEGLLWGYQRDNDQDPNTFETTFSQVWYVNRELANALSGGFFDIGVNDCHYVYDPAECNY